MSETELDVVDRLVGIEKGSRLDAVRAARPEARANAQKSYQALFEPDFPDGVTLEQRYAIAAFVAGLHRDPKILGFYTDRLTRSAGGEPRRSNPGGDPARRGRGPIWPLSAGSAHGGRQGGSGASSVRCESKDARRTSFRRAGTRPSLGFSSPRRKPCGAAIAARRRLDHDGHRHPLATGRFPFVPDPSGRGARGDRRHERKQRLTRRSR